MIGTISDFLFFEFSVYLTTEEEEAIACKDSQVSLQIFFVVFLLIDQLHYEEQLSQFKQQVGCPIW